MIFLDAGPLIAFLNKHDDLHETARRAFRALFRSDRRLLTTNRVVSEVYDAIRYDRRVSSKNDARPALAVFDAIADAGDFIDVRVATEDLEHRALAVLRAYPDQNFSFCDACSFATIEALKLREIFTFDLKDFRIYRFRRKVSFMNYE